VERKAPTRQAPQWFLTPFLVPRIHFEAKLADQLSGKSVLPGRREMVPDAPSCILIKSDSDFHGIVITTKAEWGREAIW